MPSETPTTEAKKSNVTKSVPDLDTIEATVSKKPKSFGKYSAKKEFDKFYTREDVAVDCLKLLNFNDNDLVIEPSAGNGSFYRNIN
jgi:hypothetical protein